MTEISPQKPDRLLPFAAPNPRDTPPPPQDNSRQQLFLKYALIAGGGFMAYKATRLLISTTIFTLKVLFIIAAVGAVIAYAGVQHVRRKYASAT